MPTKRPHFVPRTYLRAWASDDDQVAYRRRDRHGVVVANITNVAVATGIYGTGDAAQSREEMFNQIEAEWTALCAEVPEHGDLSGRRRSLLAVYMAIQFNRTLLHTQGMSLAAKVAATSEERPIPHEAVRKYRLSIDGSEPDDNEVQAATGFINGAPNIPTIDEVMAAPMDVAVSAVAPRMEAMRWSVRRCNRPVLMTSDRPVCARRHPDPDAPPGGVGIDTADEVRFSLTPRALLLLTPMRASGTRYAADHRRQAINEEICRRCQHFVVATPQSKTRLEAIELSTRSPRLRFRKGPGYCRPGDGTTYPMGDIIHTYFE